jgi:exodeoxyribonuclease V alpha subunit
VEISDICKDEEVFDISYTVEYILYTNPSDKFTIAKVKDVVIPPDIEVKNNNYVVQGTFTSIQPSDTFKSKGKWVQSKYGWQISVTMNTTAIPANTKGVKRFLMRFVTGIGKAYADKIVDTYGMQTLDKIREGIENLTRIPGIGKKKAQAVYDAVMSHDEVERLSLFLFQNGVTSYLDVMDIYEKEISSLMIQADPYCICDILSVSKFPLADRIALHIGETPNSISRIVHGILYYMNVRNYRDGDLYISYRDLQTDFISFLRKYGAFQDLISKDFLLSSIKSLLDEEKIVCDSVDGRSLLYPSFFHYAESYIARTLAYMDRQPCFTPETNVDEFLKIHEKEEGFELDTKQKDAVIAAANNRVCILTGGPGTGKTYTVNTIIKFFESCSADVDIQLCAPTGRAAKRMSEMSGKESKTIHRLLNINPELNVHPIKSIDPLDADVVIVDEFSMVDVVLFAQLIKALQNSKARLILVGDQEQLPSVGPGLLLKDLIESGCIPVTRLTTLFRQSATSQINTNAHKIIKGITTTDEDGLTFDIAKQDCFFLDRNTEELVKQSIVSTMQCLIKKGTHTLNDMVVLSPIHKGMLGVIALNKVLQDVFNPASPSKTEMESVGKVFRVGDRVMQLRNNYDLEVFNGEIGEIANIDLEDEKMVVAYPSVRYCESYITYRFSEVRQLNLAYAMTIHKSQGGEYPCVIMPVFHTFPNLSRNIVYTGLTRAKKTAVFIGEKSTLDNAIRTVSNIERNTRLCSRLRFEFFEKADIESDIDNNEEE